MEKLISLITLIRESHPDMIKLYTQGGCFHFHFILKSVFPNAELWYNSDHAITKLFGRFWDITGEVDLENHIEYWSNYGEKHFKGVKRECTLL